MISIITPIYNGTQFIRENIECIQKLAIPYEHIVVDGGSNDGSLDIIKEYKDLTVINQIEKSGMYGAIDMGFSIAKGKYICWINCDDRIIKNGFEAMYHHAIKEKKDFVCSDGVFLYTHTNQQITVKGTRFVKYFLQRGFFPFSQPSVIYTKKLYNEVNGLDFENFKITGDGDLFYRMSQLNHAKFGYMPVKTSVFLKHGNSLGDRNTQIAIDERKTLSTRPNGTLLNRINLKIARILHIQNIKSLFLIMLIFSENFNINPSRS